RSGSVFANAVVQAADDRNVRFSTPDGKNYNIATGDLSRVIFKSLPGSALEKIPQRATGVLLARGDFIEGELQRYDPWRIKLSSVLFGLSDLSTNEAGALVLRDSDPGAAGAAWIVRTRDGSAYAARSLKIDSD